MATKFQITCLFYGLQPYMQYPAGKILVPAYNRLKFVDTLLTSAAQVYHLSRDTMKDENRTMLPRIPMYNYTKLGFTCDADNNFATQPFFMNFATQPFFMNIATDLQFQITFQSYSLQPNMQYTAGEISVPAYYRLTFCHISLTFPAQAQRFPRKVGVYDNDPSQLHAMIEDFATRMYDEDPNLLARLFDVHHKANIA